MLGDTLIVVNASLDENKYRANTYGNKFLSSLRNSLENVRSDLAGGIEGPRQAVGPLPILPRTTPEVMKLLGLGVPTD